MNLKQAIIKTMERDDLKDVVDDLEIDSVDRRSRTAMARSVGLRKDIQDVYLLEFLSEAKYVGRASNPLSKSKAGRGYGDFFGEMATCNASLQDRSSSKRRGSLVRWIRGGYFAKASPRLRQSTGKARSEVPLNYQNCLSTPEAKKTRHQRYITNKPVREPPSSMKAHERLHNALPMDGNACTMEAHNPKSMNFALNNDNVCFFSKGLFNDI